MVERTERGRGSWRVSKLSRSGRAVRRGPAPVYSLFLLVAFSLLAAFLLTQNTVTLAYPLFQSPVESPAPTQAPAEAPTEAPGGPPEESPVVPPGETPIVPPAETPILPPSGEVTPSAGPEATPGEEGSPQVPTPTESAGEEGSSLLGRMSPAVLIDTCVVGLSSLWLCCGGFVLVVFVLLIAASFILRVS